MKQPHKWVRATGRRATGRRAAWGALAGAIVLSAAVGAGAARAGVKTFEYPPDSVALKASELPGYALARKQCSGCHSAEYMVYQPASAARPYWTAMVTRMRDVFKAPVAESDIPTIVDYLVKTYGNEQPK